MSEALIGARDALRSFMSEDKMKDRMPSSKPDRQDREADERETMSRAPTERSQGEHADGDDKAAPDRDAPATEEHSETDPDFDFEELDDEDEGPELG